MRLADKLKQFERSIVFMNWGTTAEYGKILYVGDDFVEFEVLNIDTMEYNDKVLINSQLILEVVYFSTDISRIAIEYAGRLPSIGNETNLN
ncbi:hypothetical protein IJS77_03765 [bacterium]|nr:hypothetical protein [bacterium]